MKFSTNYLLIFTFFTLFLTFSCDDEQLDPSIQNAVETILPNSDLANMMEDISATDNFECVDFQYPISFTLYNANFQVVETVTIQSDGALFAFLQGLGENENGVVLASLDFPVTLVYENATTVEINNNQELETALMAAADNCGEVESCDFDTVRAFLVSCSQIPTLNGFTPSFTTFEFYDSNELFTMYESDLPHSGTWDIAMIEGEVHVFINFNGLENFNGEYSIMDCSEDTLVLKEGDNILVLNRDCDNEENPFECFGSFDAQLTLCDELNDGIETFDLTQVFANCTSSPSYNLLYYMTLADAESGTNQIANPSSFTNVSNPQTIYVKVEFEGMTNGEVYEISLMLEDCNTDACSEEQVDAFLVECHWNVVNYNGSNDLIAYNLYFENTGVVVIFNDATTIDAGWLTSMSADGVMLSFSNVSGTNIQAMNGDWLVVSCSEERLELSKNNDLMVMERTCN